MTYMTYDMIICHRQTEHLRQKTFYINLFDCVCVWVCVIAMYYKLNILCGRFSLRRMMIMMIQTAAIEMWRTYEHFAPSFPLILHALSHCKMKKKQQQFNIKKMSHSMRKKKLSHRHHDTTQHTHKLLNG